MFIRMNQLVRWRVLGFLVLPMALVFNKPAVAQVFNCETPPANSLLNTYNSANTCGVFDNVPLSDRWAFGLIDVRDAVSDALADPDGDADDRDNVTSAGDMFHNAQWDMDTLGNLYGVAVNEKNGDMFATASSNYGSAFFLNVSVLNYGALAGGGTGGGADNVTSAGAVYRMDAVTGNPSVLATLPQLSTTITNLNCEARVFASTLGDVVRPNHGVGLGNIVHDPYHDQLFVSNWEDGRIYRLDLAGNILDAYDPDDTDNGTAGFANGEVPYGLAVSNDGTRLFYATMEEGGVGTSTARNIYSLDLNTDGSFPGTSSSVTLAGQTFDSFENATELLHTTMPDDTQDADLVTWVADLEFDDAGTLLVGMRSGCIPVAGSGVTTGSFASSYNHDAHAYTLTADGFGVYNSAPVEMRVTYDSGANGSAIAGNDVYGGVAHYVSPDNTADYVVSTSDMLAEAGPQGIAVFPEEDAADPAPISPMAAISYFIDPTAAGDDAKGVGGDVQVMNEFICPPLGSWQGNVSEDTTGDGNGDTPIAGVTLTLFLDDDGDGAPDGPAIATTTTDGSGNYSFDNLLANNYVVVQTQPSGLVSISEDEGGADDDQNETTSALNNTISGTISSGETDVNNDFVEGTALCLGGTYSVTFDEYTLATATSTTIIDSEYATGGADNTNSPLPAGVGFTVTATNGTGDAVVYNTTPGTGGNDPDLEFSNTGNTLIVQEPGNTGGTGDGGYVPDDAVGGLITFDFESPLVEFSALLTDFESPDAALVFVDTGSGSQTVVAFGDMVDPTSPFYQGACVLGNNEFCQITNPITATSLGLTSFDQVVFDMSGAATGGGTSSGGIDSISFSVACGALSGNVSQDTTGDGNGDTPISGVTLTLFADTDGDGDADGPAVATTTTDGSGDYSFTDLPPGDYVVVETQPAGLLDVSENEGGADNDQNGPTPINTISATVDSGETDVNNDFVEEAPGAWSGNVSQDTTGNGIGDTPISGVTLTLFADTDGDGDADGAPIATTTTNGSGDYIFNNLPSGDYVVVETQPAGLLDVSENEGGADNDQNGPTPVNVISGTVNPGETDVNNDFVEEAPGAITGNVSEDTTGDGNGDTPISGVTLTLFADTDGDGDADGPAITTTTTNGSGDYAFNNLPPGDYVVVETQPAGLLDVSENEGGADNDQNGPTPVNTISATVDPGETDVNNDFVEEAPGSWTGNVSQDTTGDGNGDTPISGVTLTLFADTDGDGAPDGPAIATTTTNGSGDYAFNNLPSGDYVVVETQPAGLLDVSEDEGGADDDQNGPTPVNTISGTVDPGENDSSNDFVETTSGSISGNVSQDTTGDGNGDTPISGVTLTLFADTDGDGAPDGPAITTTTTNGSGDYSFTNLPPGDYVIVETQPAGLLDVSENEGGADNDQNGPTPVNTISATVSPNENDSANDFVEEAPGAWTGNVSQDTTGDGNGDTPISGVTLSLFADTDGDGAPDGPAIATTTTNGSGDYAFNNLPSGDYVVVETQPAGLLDVSEDEGGADNDQNGPTPVNTISGTVTPGETDVNNDFVEEAPGSWTGNVSQDTTGDGNGDTPISGVTLTLFADTDGDGAPDGPAIATTTTNGSGDYAFNNLPSGDYVVVETQPAGLNDVSENEGGADDDQNGPTPVNTISGTVDPGENDSANDFVEATSGSITGNVSQDTTGDGNGDTPISGVTLTLFADTDGDGAPDGPAITTTTTNGSGDYSFTNLPAGDYVIVETQPAGLLDVSENEGGADNDQNGPTPINTISATVDPGENDSANDFVEEAPGAWTGNVSEDTTGDGNGDTPISGVTLTLFADTDGDGAPDGAALATTTTNGSGDYAFNNLPSGDYVVVETQPAGLFDVSEDEGGADDDQNGPTPVNTISGTVDPGETDVNNDFVEASPGSITGNVSEDTSGDGNGDTPISGVTLTLFADTDGDGAPDGPAITTTTTNGSGDFTFSNLPPGDYVIVETQPAGFNDVSENEGGDDDDQNGPTPVNTISATVDPGETDSGNDFVESQLGSWTGNVSEDTTGDGNGDTPISGVTLTLFADTDGDGAPDGAAITTTTTNGSGDYSFPNLLPGDYVVVETQPTGLDNITEDEGGVDDDQNGTTPINTISGTVDANENDADNDFVEGRPGIRLEKSISGVNDVNTNSIIDAGDTINYTFTVFNTGVTDLSNITITDSKLNLTAAACAPGVIAQGGAPISCTFTGAYEITSPDVANGYVVNTATTNADSASPVDGTPGTPVSDVSDTGTEPSGPGTVTPVPNPDGTETPDPDPLIPDDDLDSGDDPTTLLLAITGAISGNVSEDTTGDSNGDTPISGVTLTLFADTDGDGAPDGAALGTTTTDGSGNYIFDNLPLGDYVVVETQPAGLFDVSEAEGGDDGDDNGNAADNNQISATVSSSDPEVGTSTNEDTGNDFVEASPGSIGDTVYLDWDADGVQDAGEPGIPGVTVTLLNGAGTPIATDTTDANGEYLFTNLPPGDYQVVVTPPTGSTLSADGTYFNSGDPDTATDHDTATYGDDRSSYTLAPAENNRTQDFGYHPIVIAEDDVAATPVAGANVPDECAVITFLPGGGTDANPSTTFESILTNDIIAGPLSPAPAATTLVDLDPSDPDIDTTFVVAGEGTWDYDPVNDVLTFTPEEFAPETCFENSPTPLAYQLFELVDIDDTGTPVPVPQYADPAVLSFSRVTTPVNISFVEVEAGTGGNAVIRWVTDMETANVGFNLYQRTEDGWQLINPEVIPSQVFDATAQSRYEYRASGIVSQWIAIADIDANENVTAHGPYQVGKRYGADSVNVDEVDWSQIQRDIDKLDVPTIQQRIRRLRSQSE